MRYALGFMFLGFSGLQKNNTIKSFSSNNPTNPDSDK
jgi:hypothetical protein